MSDGRDGFPTMRCPDCGRETFYIHAYKHQRRERPKGLHPGVVLAVNMGGICTTCHRKRQGYVPSDYTPIRTLKKKHALTDEDIARCRADLEAMWRDRRARGIPPEGMNVDEWAYGNGGLYVSEVP